MKVTVSTSPHVKSSNTTRKIMLNVCIALLPATIMGVVYFGLVALCNILVSCLFALASEILYLMICKEKFKEIIASLDYSSLVTGMIIGLIIPATWHLYVPALASIFAIVVVKMLFGGTGNNLVNPAVAGRIFAFISFTTIMSTFVSPNIGLVKPTIITSATGLQDFLKDGNTLSNVDFLLGTGVAGCIGETCKVAILLGAIYLAIKGIIKIWLPLLSLLTTGVVAVMLNGFNFNVFLPSILSGGLIFTAFFMATDYVTNPNTTLGNIVFFVGFGLLTAVLRHFTGYEVVSFALLLMNILVPLIDKACFRRPFGYQKPNKEASK